MATATEVFCADCGAQNLGTKFCENCGRPEPAAFAPPPPPPTAADPALVAHESAVAANPPSVTLHTSTPPKTARRGSPLNVVVLVLYLITVSMPLVLLAAFLGLLPFIGYGAISAWSTASIVLAVILGLVAAVAALISRSSAGRRATGAFLGLLFAIVNPLPAFMNLGSLGVGAIVISALTAITIFLSWGIARPFRGPGFIALPIGLVLWLAAYLWAPTLIVGVPFLSSVAPFAQLAAIIVAPLATVLCAMAFEKGGSAVQPQPQVVA